MRISSMCLSAFIVSALSVFQPFHFTLLVKAECRNATQEQAEATCA